MVFVNCKRPNLYRKVLNDFSDLSKPIFSGKASSSCSTKYKWLGSFLFKNSSNTLINPHFAALCFYSNQEMTENEYGSILSVQKYYLHLSKTPRPKFPRIWYELTSSQYRKIGQEYTEFDEVEFFDLSRTLYSNNQYKSGSSSYNILLGTPKNIDGIQKRVIDVLHRYGDIPVITDAGYVFHYDDGSDVYVYACPPDTVKINYNAFQIILNDTEQDIYGLQEFKQYVETRTPVASGRYDVVGSGNLQTQSLACDGNGEKS